MQGAPWIVLGLALVCVAALVLSTRRSVRYAVHADEGCYLAYAATVATQGLSVYPHLIAQSLQYADTARYYPHPLRVTVVLLDAAAVRMFGVHFASLQVVSLTAFLLLLLVVYGEYLRTFGERTALWTAILLATSPFHLAMARRALADSLVATLLVTSLCLCLRALTAPPRAARRWWWGVAGLYRATFLAKEGTLILIPCSWVWLGYAVLHRQQRLTLWPWCAVSVVPLVCIAGGAWMTKNARYLLALETPMRLGSVLLLERLCRDRDGDVWATVRMALVLGCVAGAGLFTFQQCFVASQIYDPISALLLRARHIIPP